jgi:hypothetical protein
MTWVVVHFRGRYASDDIAVEFSRAVGPARRQDEARLELPPWSPILSVLPASGGALVTVPGRRYAWRGVTDVPERDATGRVTVRAYSIERWLDLRAIPVRTTWYGVTAGAAVRHALRITLGGLAESPILIGAIVESAPVLTSVEFAGQSLLALMVDLAERSGQEWWLDDSGRLHWVAAVGRFRPYLLTDAAGELTIRARDQLLDVAREYAETRAGVPWEYRDLRVPGTWPRREEIR